MVPGNLVYDMPQDSMLVIKALMLKVEDGVRFRASGLSKPWGSSWGREGSRSTFVCNTNVIGTGFRVHVGLRV